MFINVEETKLGAITWNIPGIKTIEDVESCLYFDFCIRGERGDGKKLDRGELHFRLDPTKINHRIKIFLSTKYFDFIAFKAPYTNFDTGLKNKKGDIILLARHTIDHTSLTLQLMILTRKLPLWDKEILREMRLSTGKIKKINKMCSRGF